MSTHSAMTDSTTVSSWMDAYRRAWDSNEPDDIRALFAPNAVYLTAPFSTPRRGVHEIVSGWLDDRDEPTDHSFRWTLAGIDGELAFVEGETEYHERVAGPARRYSNLWVIRFDVDGRASSFTEWYMRQGEAGGAGSLG